MSQAAAARRDLPLWIGAGALSLVAHAVAALLLSGALRELSAPPAPRPAARISIAAEEARSERLPASEARGDEVPGAAPAARRTALAAPQRMRAEPAALRLPPAPSRGDRLAERAGATRLAPAAPAGPRLRSPVAAATALAPVLEPAPATARALPARTPASVLASVRSAEPTGQAIAPAAAAAETATSPPVRQTSTPIIANGAASVAVAPARLPALARDLPPVPTDGVASAVPSSPVAGVAGARQAALAWSAAGDARLDTRSLAAIQSFVAPAAAGAGPGLRDELDAALSDLPCSRLAAAFSPGTGEILVRGHARDTAVAAAAIARIETTVGASIPVVGDLLLLPEPQCAILDAVELLGLPQSSDQADDPLVVGRAPQLRYQRFHDGDPMIFELGAADFDAWLYVDYFDAKGAVTHVLPTDGQPPRLAPAGSRLRLGGADDPGPRLTVAPPFGKDILLALAVSHPLDLPTRPPREGGAAYLGTLGAALARTRAAKPGFRGEWAYIFVETFPRRE